jgi:hypothetical protein
MDAALDYRERVRGRLGRSLSAATFMLLPTLLALPRPACADEGGVSFWLPGTYGSLAAVPQTPGWTFGSFYYHTLVSAGGDVSRAREFETGRFSSTLNANLSAKLRADTDLVLLNPAYVFETPILGGQASFGIGSFVGHANTSVNGTLAASIPPFGFIRSENVSSSTTGVGDLYPQASLKWNNGVNNFMVYATGDIPVGTYSSTSLSNLGIGHGAVDGGFGYTYLNTVSGLEFSGVAGLTYNMMNMSTHYRNGLDFHLDWGVSQFLSQQFFVGAVGYLYDQVTGDSGSGDHVGAFKSRVIGIGPQVGYIFPVSDSVPEGLWGVCGKAPSLGVECLADRLLCSGSALSRKGRHVSEMIGPCWVKWAIFATLRACAYA